MKNFLFNIYDNYNTSRTEITFLGIKLKFYNERLIRIPDYTNALNKVKEKYKNKEKIRVAFYVSENAKWNAEELYKLLEQSEEFEPIVVVSLLSYVHEGDDVTRNNLQENYDFFKKSGKNVVKAYDKEKKEYIPLENFDIDIIFYQQPWGIPDIHNIERTKDFALSCHISYGVVIFDCDLDYRPFFKKLFCYFASIEQMVEKMKEKGFFNTYAISFPKLDIYKSIKRTKKEEDKKTIIYAPHFSYQKNSLLKIGTFNRTGEQILEFAKQHPEYNWVFKPHPVLKNELYHDKKYGKKFVEKYYSEWAEIGEIYDQGNYFELFMNSDLLITDCCAFLLEYLPSLQPLIRLENQGGLPFSVLGKELINVVYRTKTFAGFEKIFIDIFQKNNDYLKEKRTKFINSIIEKKNSSEQIVEILQGKINEGK